MYDIIILTLGFFLNNYYVHVGDTVYLQTVGIPIGD